MMKTMMRQLVLGAALAFGVAAAAANTPAAEAATPRSEGEVRKVDKEAGKMTIRHGELKNLGMPPMTMVFRAADPGMLERVKPGDKVSFVAQKVDGAITVTDIEVAR
ncbi:MULTISPECIES: copper-binding protein [unclassified Janthinobacterium]|uniref:copper-binding protein n=1 Tax=unclassified Janthinobacterium TaxID=2610881 RepID=UPI0003479762|nr:MULTISPECIES: copper-binding protein [unclassified Janthinobacterium]MEC5162001.1 Cu(I)/Ag(I) efflux system protein CusF [Janthinobacterium sp. CG_S6]